MEFDPDLDVHAALDERRPEDLMTVWLAYVARVHYKELKKTATEGGPADVVTYAEQHLAQLPHVTAMQAIDANRRLGGYITGTNRTWIVQHAKYDRGYSWNEIGTALGMSKQAAWEAYRRDEDDIVPIPPAMSWGQFTTEQRTRDHNAQLLRRTADALETANPEDPVAWLRHRANNIDHGQQAI